MNETGGVSDTGRPADQPLGSRGGDAGGVDAVGVLAGEPGRHGVEVIEVVEAIPGTGPVGAAGAEDRGKPLSEIVGELVANGSLDEAVALISAFRRAREVPPDQARLEEAARAFRGRTTLRHRKSGSVSASSSRGAGGIEVVNRKHSAAAVNEESLRRRQAIEDARDEAAAQAEAGFYQGEVDGLLAWMAQDREAIAESRAVTRQNLREIESTLQQLQAA
jgi:hypothetical protein